MLREEGNDKVLRSDERVRERNEERDNKRRRRADGNQADAARGGVEDEAMTDSNGNDDGDGNFASRDNQQQQSSGSSSSQGNLQQQQQHQQQEPEESMIGAISCDNQVTDMTDWDFNKSERVQEAINVVGNRQGLAIILSTATAVTKFDRSQSNSVDPHRSMRAPLSHVNKTIKCAREQDNRGLYFVLESISEKGDEGDEAMKGLVNQKGICCE